MKSCGPINCQLETAKSFLKLRKVASFCGLPTCKDYQLSDATSQSPFEVTLEYCRRSNCVEFWTAASSSGSRQSTVPSSRTSKTLQLPTKLKSCLVDIHSSNQIFSSPECDQPSCPKKARVDVSESREGHENEIQVAKQGSPTWRSVCRRNSLCPFHSACR